MAANQHTEHGLPLPGPTDTLGRQDILDISNNVEGNFIPISARTPTGSIILFSNVTPPDGWLPCDGAAVSRVTYADLFATIGTLYGTGDGSTTFNVPNMTGRFPLGYDANLGAIGGASTHQLTEAQLPAIARGITYLGGASPVYLGGTGSETGYQLSYTQKSNALTSSDITVKFGGGQAFNKMPPHIALAYIIKT